MLALEMAAFWLSGQWNSGAVVVTPVIAFGVGGSYASWLVSCADGDTFILINHGLKQSSPSGNPATDAAPDEVLISPLTSGIALAGAYAATVSSTQIALTKQNAVGSGGAPAVKVVAERPHSIKQ